MAASEFDYAMLLNEYNKLYNNWNGLKTIIDDLKDNIEDPMNICDYILDVMERFEED